jgi:Protein of unknown function (DUF3631)
MMLLADLAITEPHPIRQPNGELRVSVDVVHRESGRVVASDTLNLRSQLSRQRLAQQIAALVDDADAIRIDRQLVALIPQAEAAAVAPTRDTGPQLYRSIEPADHPVDGAALLADLQQYLTSYIILPEQAPITAAAWVMAAWCTDQWDRFPHLAICSPTKRCGKTRLLDALQMICPRAVGAASISPAALFRFVDQCRPTLLLDEAEWVSGRSDRAEAIRGLLNAGIERGSLAIRCDGESSEPTAFHVYSPKVLACIGDLNEVLRDRCLVIEMERKRPGESVRPWRKRHVEQESLPLARRLARWSADRQEELAHLYDRLDPFGLESDRAAEMYLPLQTVVSLADPRAVADLERAARCLTPSDSDADSPGVRLLAAVRDIFLGGGATFIPTTRLLAELYTREDEPWRTWSKGKEMTSHALSRLFRPFGVSSDVGADKNTRGYFRHSLLPIWERYLGGGETPADQSAASAPSAPSRENKGLFSLDSSAGGASGASGALIDTNGDTPF